MHELVLFLNQLRNMLIINSLTNEDKSYVENVCNVVLLVSLIWLIAVEGEKHDVRDIDDCPEADNLILKLLGDLSVRISGLMEIIARAIDVPKLSRRWKRPVGGERVPFIFIDWFLTSSIFEKQYSFCYST